MFSFNFFRPSQAAEVGRSPEHGRERVRDLRDATVETRHDVRNDEIDQKRRRTDHFRNSRTIGRRGRGCQHFAVYGVSKVDQLCDDQWLEESAETDSFDGQLFGRGLGQGLRRKSGRFGFADGKTVRNFVDRFTGNLPFRL